MDRLTRYTYVRIDKTSLTCTGGGGGQKPKQNIDTTLQELDNFVLYSSNTVGLGGEEPV